MLEIKLLYCIILITMNLISSNTNIDQYIKKTYVVINSNDISLKMPTIHIIGMNDFSETFGEYLDYSFDEDELIICLPSNDIFEYLTDYFDKMPNAETQFLIDAYRSVLFYNCKMYIGEEEIDDLNKILRDTYEPKLLKKIYCLCSQGSLAFIICACQTALYKRNKNHIISELGPNKQQKLDVNIIQYNNKINIILYKTMRIINMERSKCKFDTLHVLRFQIEYLIDMENEDYVVESVIKIDFLNNNSV